jgi:hypothetical protein
MTRSGNITRLRCALLMLALSALACLSWSRDAQAQVFAGMCDESASSMIAPLPVEVRDHGEIGIDPCANLALLEVLEGVPPDRDAPPIKVESSQPYSLVGTPADPEVRPGAASHDLRPGEVASTGSLRAQSVYRPPR